MGFRDRGSKRSFRKANNDKYLRLTGLWPSKSNEELWTGRLKPEQLEDLLKQVEEALEAGAPLVFSLWENSKKESRKDPDFSLQSFVGDTEDKPSSRRSSRRDEKEEDDNDDKDDSDDKDDKDEKEEKEEKDEKPSKGRRSSAKDEKSSSKSKSRDKW